MRKLICVSVLWVLGCSSMVSVFDSRPLFAFESVIVGDDERFLDLRKRQMGRLKPEEREKVHFAIAEYYFEVKDFIDANIAFEDYLKSNRSGISTLLANTYLYKLAKLAGQDEKASAFKKTLFQNQFILLFSDFKTLEYTSANNNKYEIRYFVDKIEVYLNGEILEQVSP